MHSSLYTTYTTHFHPIHAPGFPSTPPAHHLFLVLYPSLHSTPTSISLSRFIRTHFLHITTSHPSTSAWPPQPLYPLLLMPFIPPPVHCHYFRIHEGPMQTGPISTPIFHPSHILSLTYPSPRADLRFFFIPILLTFTLIFLSLHHVPSQTCFLHSSNPLPSSILTHAWPLPSIPLSSSSLNRLDQWQHWGSSSPCISSLAPPAQQDRRQSEVACGGSCPRHLNHLCSHSLRRFRRLHRQRVVQ